MAVYFLLDIDSKSKSLEVSKFKSEQAFFAPQQRYYTSLQQYTIHHEDVRHIGPRPFLFGSLGGARVPVVRVQQSLHQELVAVKPTKGLPKNLFGQ